jgi:hypothetical protein
MKLWKRQTPPEAKTPRFHPQTILRDWGNGHAFRLSDALTGVCCFGTTGSGKTSSVARHIAHGYLAAGFGFLILCSKPSECEQWCGWVKNCEREDDLVIVDAAGTWRFNPLDWEASRAGEGAGLGSNVVNLLDEIAGAISGIEDTTGSSKFWDDSRHLMLTNLVDLVILAGLQISLPLLRSIVTTAPYTPEQAKDPHWQSTSACQAIINEADRMTKDGDPDARADFESCWDYWMVDFPNLSEKTRSIITLTFALLAKPFVTRPLRKIFSSDTNITPEATFDGKIIVVNLPVQEFGLVGRIANLTWKFCTQKAILRRKQPESGYLRPVAIFADEAQMFISKFDSEYQSVARSAGGATVYLTQNIESFRRVLKNNDAVDSLLGNLQALFFCANTGFTNEWASKLMGEHWTKVSSTNVGQSRNDGGTPIMQPQANSSGGFNSGLSRSEQRRFYVEPAVFTTLKRGGLKYNFQVEAIAYLAGQQFQNGKNLVPYIKLTFNQK